MFVVHRSLHESVCSHQCYHLQEEVMTSGCCAIVQQDSASLYRRGTETHAGPSHHTKQNLDINHYGHTK